MQTPTSGGASSGGASSGGASSPAARMPTKVSSGSPRPQWEKGGGCSECAIGFTAIRRRHHCRACGGLICDDCSFSKALPDMGYKKKQRVCETCIVSRHPMHNALVKQARGPPGVARRTALHEEGAGPRAATTGASSTADAADGTHGAATVTAAGKEEALLDAAERAKRVEAELTERVATAESRTKRYEAAIRERDDRWEERPTGGSGSAIPPMLRRTFKGQRARLHKRCRLPHPPHSLRGCVERCQCIHRPRIAMVPQCGTTMRACVCGRLRRRYCRKTGQRRSLSKTRNDHGCG